MSIQASHCGDNQIFIAILLKQAGGIFGKLHFDGGVLNGDLNDADGYEVLKSEEFAELIQESKVLVNYTDCFVLKHPSDKMTETFGIDRNIADMDPYGALCYVTGILDTIVSNVPKRNIPQRLKLKTGKQKSVIHMAIYHSHDLKRYAQKVEDDGREEMYVTMMSKKQPATGNDNDSAN